MAEHNPTTNPADLRSVRLAITPMSPSRIIRPVRLALVAAIVCCALVAQKGAEFSAPVIGISDGDTIKVLQDGVSKRIRLWGIDCPEMKQAFGTRAKQFTGDLAFGKTVTLRVHDVDRYGRQVAEIILPDGRNLNHEIVRAGFAWWYRQYARHDAELERLEAEAEAAKRGLRADKEPMPPWEFRRSKARASQ
jgi:micrococcal nuclease